MADPTRRQILHRLTTRPLSVAEIAEGLTTSQPNVSQHLRVLREAGLVRVTPVGTRRIYAPAPDGLAALHEELEGFWRGALDNFKKHIDQHNDQEQEHRHDHSS